MQRLWKAAFAAVVVLLVVEIVPRLFGTAPTLGLSQVPAGILVPSPIIGYSLPTDALVRLGGVEVKLNELGLRGDLPAPGRRVAVLTLGDDVTFGWGVGKSESYPARLGALLERDHPGCGAVLNAGVPGYTSYQGLLLLQDLTRRYRPQVVVAEFGFNDPLNDGPLNRLLALDGEWSRADAFRWWLRAHSETYCWSAWLLDRAEGRLHLAQPRVSPRRFQRNMRAIATAAARVGASTVYLDVGLRRGVVRRWSAGSHPIAEELPYDGALRSVVQLEGMPLVAAGDTTPDQWNARLYEEIAGGVERALLDKRILTCGAMGVQGKSGTPK